MPDKLQSMPDRLDPDEWDIPCPMTANRLDPDKWGISRPMTTKPRKAAPAPRFAGLDSFARLAAKKGTSSELEYFKKKVRALPEWDTQSLVVRIATTSDALMLWAIHCQLEKRNLAPSQRWPGNTNSGQMLFVSWCADLAWFIKRNPDHAPCFKSWLRLFTLKTCSPQWLEVAYRLFDGMSGRSLAHVTSKALALTDAHRQELATLPTQAMIAARRELEPAKLEGIRNRLLSHALLHRDRSGTHTPIDIANRRATLYRVHVLSGKHAPTTAKNWQALTGKSIARQTVADHLNTIADVLRATRFLE